MDFDNTICYSNYPECGEPNINIIGFLKHCKAQGATIILWTCREGESLQVALEWCKQYGLEFDYVNENDPRRTEIWKTDCRKIGADYYIDDKSIHPDNISFRDIYEECD